MRKKEILNWWWFLFIAGVVIPIVNILFAPFPASYGFFRGLFVEGLNPYLGNVLSFFVILMMYIVFKMLLRIPFPITITRILYILSGLAVLYLFLEFLIPRNVEIYKAPHRSYIDYSQTVSFNKHNVHDNHSIFHYMIHIVLAVLTFILFFLINFPSGMKNKIKVE